MRRTAFVGGPARSPTRPPTHNTDGWPGGGAGRCRNEMPPKGHFSDRLLTVGRAGVDGAVDAGGIESARGHRRLVEEQDVEHLPGGAAEGDAVAFDRRDVGDRIVRSGASLDDRGRAVGAVECRAGPARVYG